MFSAINRFSYRMDTVFYSKSTFFFLVVWHANVLAHYSNSLTKWPQKMCSNLKCTVKKEKEKEWVCNNAVVLSSKVNECDAK